LAATFDLSDFIVIEQSVEIFGQGFSCVRITRSHRLNTRWPPSFGRFKKTTLKPTWNLRSPDLLLMFCFHFRFTFFGWDRSCLHPESLVNLNK
jgi:hypothetical protein